MDLTPVPPAHPTRTLRWRRLALVLALATPIVMAACSDDEPERATVESEAASDTDASGNALSGGSGSEPASDDEDGGGDAATGSSGSRDEVIGTSTGNHQAGPIDSTLLPLRLDVHSLRRTSGDIVEVLFSVTNEGDVDYDPYSTLADPSIQGYDVGGAALIDAPNDTRYLTLYDSDDVCLCTDDLQNLSVPAGETAAFNVSLSAPPEDVTEVTFTLPGFDPIDGLEIS